MSRVRSVGLGVLWFMSGVAGCAASLSVEVTTPAGRRVEDAAVVLEPMTAGIPLRHSRRMIEQIDREFVPYLTVVQTGTAIEFPNRDPLLHHVYSFSPPKVFEIKLYAGKPVAPIVFDKPGVVVLGCNIHDWMEAYVLVVDSPYFAKTGADGWARLSGLPAGHYRLSWWHPRQKASTGPREVEIGSTSAILRLAIDVSPRLVTTKPPLDAESY